MTSFISKEKVVPTHSSAASMNQFPWSRGLNVPADQAEDVLLLEWCTRLIGLVDPSRPCKHEITYAYGENHKVLVLVLGLVLALASHSPSPSPSFICRPSYVTHNGVSNWPSLRIWGVWMKLCALCCHSNADSSQWPPHPRWVWLGAQTLCPRGSIQTATQVSLNGQPLTGPSIAWKFVTIINFGLFQKKISFIIINFIECQK